MTFRAHATFSKSRCTGDVLSLGVKVQALELVVTCWYEAAGGKELVSEAMISHRLVVRQDAYIMQREEGL